MKLKRLMRLLKKEVIEKYGDDIPVTVPVSIEIKGWPPEEWTLPIVDFRVYMKGDEPRVMLQVDPTLKLRAMQAKRKAKEQEEGEIL